VDDIPWLSAFLVLCRVVSLLLALAQPSRRDLPCVQHTGRRRLKEACTACDRPPEVIGTLNDNAFQAPVEQFALMRVSEGNVHNFFRQPDSDAHMGAVDRVPQRR
jgi:hypothetical protein